MTRAIAIISCLIAALFLVPVQAECIEAAEGEPEAETGCCIAISCLSQSEVEEQLPAIHSPLMTGFRREHVLPKASGDIIHLPARILHCVFRE